jgi:DNA modification methylase
VRYVATETVPVDALEAYPGNARVHDEPALDESARTNGQYRSVVARRLDGGTLQLLAGHGTVGAFRRQGAAEVRVEVIEADDTEARRIVLADNGSSRNAGYDERLLLELLDAASKDGGLGGTGWDGEAYKDLLDAADEGNPFDFDPDSDADDFDEEPPEEPVTQSGDVWVLGPHRIVCGDCRDPQVVASLLDGVKVNVAFTSPPYASQRKYDETSEFKPIHPDEYVDWFDGVQAVIREHLSDDGSWFVNIKEHADGGQRHLYVKDLTIAHVRHWGWMFVDELCWVDTKNGVPGGWNNRFKDAWEPVFHFAQSTKIRFNPLANGTQSDDVFDYSADYAKSTSGSGFLGTSKGRDFGEGIARPSNVIHVAAQTARGVEHSAQFPVDLPRWFIRAYSDPGDAVFDPFMGSGTTTLAAHQEGRVSYGCEISPRYCDVIARRYQDLTGDMPVLERTGERFDFHGADGPVAVAA